MPVVCQGRGDNNSDDDNEDCDDNDDDKGHGQIRKSLFFITFIKRMGFNKTTENRRKPRETAWKVTQTCPNLYKKKAGGGSKVVYIHYKKKLFLISDHVPKEDDETDKDKAAKTSPFSLYICFHIIIIMFLMLHG